MIFTPIVNDLIRKTGIIDGHTYYICNKQNLNPNHWIEVLPSDEYDPNEVYFIVKTNNHIHYFTINELVMRP